MKRQRHPLVPYPRAHSIASERSAGSPAAFGLVRHHLLLLHDHAMTLFNFLPRTGWLKQAAGYGAAAPCSNTSRKGKSLSF